MRDVFLRSLSIICLLVSSLLWASGEVTSSAESSGSDFVLAKNKSIASVVRPTSKPEHSKDVQTVLSSLTPLDLSDEQKQRIELLADKYDIDIRALSKKMMRDIKRLTSIKTDSNYDRDKMIVVAADIGENYKQRIILNSDLKHHIMSLLTPKQQAQV